MHRYLLPIKSLIQAPITAISRTVGNQNFQHPAIISLFTQQFCDVFTSIRHNPRKIIIACRAQYSAQNGGVNSRWYACRGGWLLVYKMYLPQPHACYIEPRFVAVIQMTLYLVRGSIFTSELVFALGHIISPSRTFRTSLNLVYYVRWRENLDGLLKTLFYVHAKRILLMAFQCTVSCAKVVCMHVYV